MSIVIREVTILFTCEQHTHPPRVNFAFWGGGVIFFLSFFHRRQLSIFSGGALAVCQRRVGRRRGRCGRSPGWWRLEGKAGVAWRRGAGLGGYWRGGCWNNVRHRSMQGAHQEVR